MAEGTAAHRDFADRKHASGQWHTRTVYGMSRPIRAGASFISSKRWGVDLLARVGPQCGIAVDFGAGQGAYAQWFSSVNKGTVVAIDLSFEALRRQPPLRSGTMLRLCADGHHLPLKAACADALYSIDTLGHVADPEKVLDEILRVVKPGARLFLHSECSDYRDRWPDRMLMRRLGYDLLARHDGHVSLLPAAMLRTLVARRFLIDRIWSPAGLTGWLTGYPEKYQRAFRAARCRALALLTAVFAFVKKAPLAGLLLRLLNASLNHLEITLGIQGGGSVFMLLRKPMENGGQDAPASREAP
jgi:SAM-dependent methyltransferase